VLTKSNLEKLAQMRLDDALFLLQAGRWSTAYYVAGYAVEMALKASIAKLFSQNVIPDRAFVNAIYVHKFNDLLSAAGLRPAYDAEVKADPQFSAYWGIASKWDEGSRYELWDAVSAQVLVDAISEPNHGVFRWVKMHW
jgi:hypothetical protein